MVGTKSLLSPDISHSEIFPSGYTPYRADRQSSNRGGGVLEVTGTHPLFIGACYRPKEDDQASLLEL